jgi:hypothetical protein
MPNDDEILIPGFTKPESVVHDTAQDVYFVSNVGAGSPSALDKNGFISRVSPDGTIAALKAIDGLNGPKGLWISEDKLYVADINTLRIFHRVTGQPIATFDIAEQLRAETAKTVVPQRRRREKGWNGDPLR